MPSSYPAAPDDLTVGNTGLTHGQVSDAVAAVQATLGVNPQGDAATVVARLDTIGTGEDGRTILSGSGAPASGSGLEPLDGINDPWRWSALLGGWVGPVYEVTVADGATVDLSGETLPAAAAEVDLFVVSGTTLHTFVSPDALFGSNSYITWGVGTGTSTADGTGIAFLLQSETDYAGPTAVPDATLDVTAVLATDSTGITVGSAYTFPEIVTGVDGDFYIDTTAHTLYGPKAGTWPSPVSLVGPQGDPGVDGLPILTSTPGNIAWRVIVADDGTLSTEAV